MLSDTSIVDHLQDKSWFDSLSHDEYNRYIIYVHHMNEAIFNSLPSNLDGKPVLWHFALSKKNNYIDESYILDENHLIKELDYLESLCGSKIMQDIFYEVHDGTNAVTNFSSTFPTARTLMENLYNTYGFDLIYDNMDG